MELTSRAYINSMNKNNYTDVRICQCLSFHWEKKINVTFPVYMYIDLVVCTKIINKIVFIIDLFLEINLSREA